MAPSCQRMHREPAADPQQPSSLLPAPLQSWPGQITCGWWLNGSASRVSMVYWNRFQFNFCLTTTEATDERSPLSPVLSEGGSHWQGLLSQLDLAQGLRSTQHMQTLTPAEILSCTGRPATSWPPASPCATGGPWPPLVPLQPSPEAHGFT